MVLVGSDSSPMTSPAGILQGQTAGHYIAEIGDWVQRKMLEERDTKRHAYVCHGLLPCDRALMTYVIPLPHAS